MLLFPTPMAIVDLETTGMSAIRDRVIELAILRIENNKLVETFSTLVNPEMNLPQEIEVLTGIYSRELTSAPRFFDVMDQVRDLLTDAVFVAHNARFDYSFMRQEMKRYGIRFNAKELCTARLFRAIAPERKHNLDALIDAYKIKIDIRHRALSDAKVLWEFLKILGKTHPKKDLSHAIGIAMHRPMLPNYISHMSIDALPESPGVYRFLGDNGVLLYIGKSINLKHRILSHFQDALTSVKEQKIREQIRDIEVTVTAGELSALLLESTLIKEHRPLYNRQGRHAFKLVAAQAIQNDGDYIRINLETVTSIDADAVPTYVGIFRSKSQANQFLRELGEKHKLCPKLLGFEHGKGGCFWRGLGWCAGACIGEESSARYNMRAIKAISRYKLKAWPFSGPVLIRESTDDRSEAMLVDKWCILRTARWNTDADLPVSDITDYAFDLDTYKILLRYVTEKRNHKNIKILSDVTTHRHR